VVNYSFGVSRGMGCEIAGLSGPPAPHLKNGFPEREPGKLLKFIQEKM